MSTQIRTLFVSDVHLGFRHARPHDFLTAIRQYDPENIIIVGDFIDGRRLENNWRWDNECDRIFSFLRGLAKRGTIIRYLPGNHDEFLRQPENQCFDFFNFQNEMEYELDFGGVVSILHGDIYDRTEVERTLGTRFGCKSYDFIVHLHVWANHLSRRMGIGRLDVCALVKSWLWQASRHIHGFTSKLCRHAKFNNNAGVVCGHIHSPRLQLADGLLYINTGDWVENSSLVVETCQGDLELINHGKLVSRLSKSEMLAQVPMKKDHMQQVNLQLQHASDGHEPFDFSREFRSLFKPES